MMKNMVKLNFSFFFLGYPVIVAVYNEKPEGS